MSRATRHAPPSWVSSPSMMPACTPQTRSGHSLASWAKGHRLSPMRTRSGRRSRWGDAGSGETGSAPVVGPPGRCDGAAADGEGAASCEVAGPCGATGSFGASGSCGATDSPGTAESSGTPGSRVRLGASPQSLSCARKASNCAVLAHAGRSGAKLPAAGLPGSASTCDDQARPARRARSHTVVGRCGSSTDGGGVAASARKWCMSTSVSSRGCCGPLSKALAVAR